MPKISFESMKKDRTIWRRLRSILTNVEKLWLLDCGGDYEIYRARLHRLAHDHGIITAEGEFINKGSE